MLSPRRTRRKLIISLAIAGLVAGTLAGTAGLVFAASGPGQNFFELDASKDPGTGAAPHAAITDNATAGTPDDWDRICHTFTNGAQCPTAGNDNANARSFDSETNPDGTANNATIFTGGGSKDQGPISGWNWKDATGGLPDKDNLLHAMSARYGAGATSHIYFAADRFDNSGDSQLGFWFFNNKIGPQAGGGFGPGAHKAGVVPHDSNNAGDILILADFTQGGTQPTVRVFEYVGACTGCTGTPSDGTLNLLGGNATDVRDCAVVTSDDFCASVNPTDGATVPWLFKNKSGQTTFGHGEFFEGGLNLASLGLASECFSSFLAETRSSQSVTATLKDFIGGPFQNCSAGVSTTPSVNGSTSIGAGASVTVHDTATVSVNGTSTFSATLAFALCGPIATGNCQAGGTAVAAKTGVDPVTANGSYDSADVVLHSAGRYCWRGVLTIQSPAGIPGDSDPRDGTSTTECFVITPLTPTILTHASAPVEIGNPIHDTATIGNTALQPDGSNAGGSVTFKAYGPNDATCAKTPAFASASIAVSGNGDYGSGAFTPTTAGTYLWVASYTGNTPNTSGPVATGCGDANESVVVSPKTPTIITNATAGPLPLGSMISDTATIGNTSPRPDASPAGGSVTFKAYGPNDATCANTPAFTSAAISVSGNGDYNSGNFTPTLAGTYLWIATYTGDPPNTSGPVSTSCGDANESSVIISLQPTLDTVQRFRPNDSATVQVATGAGNLTGNVRFQLFVNNSTCTGTADYDSGNIDVTTGMGNGQDRTVSSNNTTEYMVSGTTYSWLVTYVSTNSGIKNVTSVCNNENSSITINNGVQSNTP